MSPAGRVALVVVILAAAGGGYWWWQRKPPPPPAPPPVARPIAPATVEPLPIPAAPKIRHPVETPGASRGGLPAIDDSDDYFKKALENLLGKKSVLSFLAIDGFVRRFVATVNNLATDNTASELWPVRPTPGRLFTENRAGGTVINSRNSDRYVPFMRFVDAVDTQRAVALYVAVYPLLQRAYEDLGFPGKYFNDRVVEVIDHLLATPEVAEPIKVKRVAADGVSAPGPTGGLYLYEDPALENSSSGQKIMLRVGRANAARLKVKLTDIRHRITKGAIARTPP